MSQGQVNFKLVLGGIVLAGVAFMAWKMTSGKAISIPANVVVTASDTTGFRGYLIGDTNAPVEITEYADFECSVCAGWAVVQYPAVKSGLIDKGKVLWRIRDYPLPMHRHPIVASHAVACANDQGKLEPAVTRMFETQNDWSLVADPIPGLKKVMQEVGVDVPAWTTCMQSAKYAGRIQASSNEGSALGVNGTPSFLIAGKLYDGRMTSDEMTKLVDSLIAAKNPSSTKP